MSCVIDAEKLAPLTLGDTLVLAHGEKVKIHSIEKTNEPSEFCLIPIMGGNQSYALEGGLVVDGCIGVHLDKGLFIEQLGIHLAGAAPVEMSL